jgi:NAD(P)-dependent dehydrogenase (short-subunit alcohol dehydrogenase family)
MKSFLLFGASGTIGSACKTKLSNIGEVISGQKDYSLLENQIRNVSRLDGVVWAQGLNGNDSIANFNIDAYSEMLQANLGFIFQTAKILLSEGKVSRGTNFVVISSIWSQLSRPNKLSYSVSKAGISAAVRSMAVDLGPTGIQVNAISPGPIESPMTRENLSEAQINFITDQTPLKRLVSLDEVANVAYRFANGEMPGITGQEIFVDGGWGVSKLV